MPVKIKEYPNKKYLRKLFNYDNGYLIRKTDNKLVGSDTHNHGYHRIKLDFTGVSKYYYAHRLIWIWHYGDIPEHLRVDHIDLNKKNNNISNLQLLTHASNLRRLKLSNNNTSGFTGVYWYKKTGKWCAQIKGTGKVINIGYFEKLEDAVKARKQAEAKYNFHHNHGKNLRNPNG